MNTIAAEMVETPGKSTAGESRPFIAFELRIDGEPCPHFEGLSIDAAELSRSAKDSDGYYFGNCGCGEPQCAGIPEGVQVDHEADCIRWRVPVPYTAGRGSPKPETFAEYAFAADDYLCVMGNLVADLQSLAAREAKGERFSIDCHAGTLARQLLEWIEAG